MKVEEAILENCVVSSSLPGRGCWTRRDFYDFLNTVWVCAEQSEPVQKRLGGRRCGAAITSNKLSEKLCLL